MIFSFKKCKINRTQKHYSFYDPEIQEKYVKPMKINSTETTKDPYLDERLKKALESASAALAGSDKKDNKNIGVMKEKTLHSVLKFFYEPDSSYHEAELGRFVADIFKDDTVIEIQTGSFYPIAKKIKEILNSGYKLILVHPIDANDLLNGILP